MKTLVVCGRSPMPAALREIVDRGSTSLEERRAAELDEEPVQLEADRVVFWAERGDAAVARLAERYARAEAARRKEALVFVTPDGSGVPPGLPDLECFVWPRDEDRLRMAFLTGA